MLCRVLLNAVILRHGTDGFTSPPKEVCALRNFIVHKNPPSSVGPEPATEGTVASTLTIRPPRAVTMDTLTFVNNIVINCLLNK
jgi:hypothetical protein